MNPIFLLGIWICFILFVLRVLAQIYVALYSPKWLPPMEQWYSGVMPYGQLLPSQFIIMIIMTMVTYDYTRGEGFFYVQNLFTSRILLGLSALYFSGMMVRFFISKRRNPGISMPRGTIPIIFHCVLALFLFLCSRSA